RCPAIQGAHCCKFSTTGKSEKGVKPHNQKYSVFQNMQIRVYPSPSRTHKRDVSRSSRTLGADAMDAAISGVTARFPKGVRFAAGRKSAAYGEIVWSWRRDRGVYPVLPALGPATVTINAAHRGESTYKP